MCKNYNLDWDDYTAIDRWDYDALEKYGVDFNGCWYKVENEEN